jgi:hypothetical protein
MKKRVQEVAGGFVGVFSIARMISNGAVSLSWTEFRELPNTLVEAIAIYQQVKDERRAK